VLLAEARRRGILTLAQAIERVVGAKVKGSWWAHPRGKEIFAALSALDDSLEVLAVKLPAQAWVHEKLWPALARAQRERALWPPPGGEAKRLLARVRRAGEGTATGKPRLELERAMLVVGRQEHTETGAHRVVLVPFDRWLPAKVARAAEKLSLDDAVAALEQAGWERRR
jgi:hypothetical protein